MKFLATVSALIIVGLVYGLVDGSVKTVWGGTQGDTKKFDDFEKQHSPPPNQ